MYYETVAETVSGQRVPLGRFLSKQEADEEADLWRGYHWLAMSVERREGSLAKKEKAA